MVLGDLRVRDEAGRGWVVAHDLVAGRVFLYENAGARKLVQHAAATSRSRHDRRAHDEHDRIEATWRERALNAEDGLTRAQREIDAQRQKIGELMGQLRDVEQRVPGESVQRLMTENTTLKRQNLQLAQEHRTLQERLEGALTREGQVKSVGGNASGQLGDGTLATRTSLVTPATGLSSISLIAAGNAFSLAA
jgi:TolA-binding protein